LIRIVEDRHTRTNQDPQTHTEIYQILMMTMADKGLGSLLVARDMAIGGVMTVTVDDSLNTALELMAANDVRELPVVAKTDPRRVVTVISRKDITRAYQNEIERAKRTRS
jgi:CBS domain-containing protein